MKIIFCLVLGAFVTFCTTQQAIATPQQTPLAYQIFCLNYTNHCNAESTQQITKNQQLMFKLNKVNRQINRRIKPRVEQQDVWTYNPQHGDCKDYVLTKRYELIRAGTLRIAVVKTENNIGHAIFIVKGNLVLDNRRKNIIPPHKTGYKFLKISTSNPFRWETYR